MCLLLFTTLSLAQQASLEISVFNKDNKPVAFIPVKIENPGIGFEKDEFTNELGKIKLSGLSTAGEYQIITGETNLYKSLVTQPIKLRSNQTKSINLIIEESSNLDLQEIIISGNDVASINAMDAEVSSQLTSKEISAIPIEGRDVTRVLFRLPNVTQATGFFPEAPNVSINGANSLFNNYMIDGMDNNEQFLGGTRFNMPVGAVQNISVLTNNYSAEFGNTGNGIINLTTKSGSNEITGEVFFVTRPGLLDANTDFVLRDLSGNQVQDGFQRYQGGFSLGGPIRKDQTFFFVNLEHTTDLKDNVLSSPALNVAETIQGTNTFNYFTGKIDHYWSDRAKSSVRANLGFVAIDRQAGGLSGGVNFPSAANAQQRNSINLVSQNLYTISDNINVETHLQYSRFDWNYASPENPDNPNVTVLGPEGPIAVLGHPGFVFDSDQSTLQFQQKFSWDLGKHAFKSGLKLLSTDHQLFGGGNPNGSYTVRLTEQQINELASLNPGSGLSINDIPSDALVTNYAIELRPSSFGTRQSLYSIYLEDQFQASSRLNLNLGLRYDYDNLSKGGSDKGDFNNIAPRVSFNYKISPRSVIRGGYGIFYDKVLYAIYSDALQQNNTSVDFRTQIQYFIDQGVLPSDTDLDAVTFPGNLVVGTANNAGLPFAYLEGPPAASFAGQRNLFSNERRILNPNGYDNPYTQQISIGYQQQLGSSTLFYVDLLYNRGENLFRTRNLNAPEAWDYQRSERDLVARASSWADSTRRLPIYDGSFAIVGSDTLTGAARSVVMTETAGRSNYYAASFNLQKDRKDDWYAFRLIYTLSYLENNTEDINFRAMDANDFKAEWGPSINDRRHVINAFASIYPLNNLTITLAALLQSGQPINRIPDASLYRVIDSEGNIFADGNGNPITTNDLNGDGSAFGDAYVGNSDRFPGAGRNADRLPWAETIDLGIQYRVPLSVAQKLELRADVFNLLNSNNLSGYSNNATQSNQIQTGPIGSAIVQRNAAPPRQFQFSMRYLF